jgi:hypothetical protein
VVPGTLTLLTATRCGMAWLLVRSRPVRDHVPAPALLLEPAPPRPTRLVVRCRRYRLTPNEKRIDVDVTTRLGAPHPLHLLPRAPPGDGQDNPCLLTPSPLLAVRRTNCNGGRSRSERDCGLEQEGFGRARHWAELVASHQWSHP